MAETSHKVYLHVYDLSQGMARQMSPMLMGKQIDGIWHTGVVINGLEYFFGAGIHKMPAGRTHFGQPLQVLELGTTEISGDLLQQLLDDMAPRYRPQDYSLLFHNCNNFSNEFSQLLTGASIPEYINLQVQEALNTPLGQMLMPMLLQMEEQLGSATADGFTYNQSGASGPSDFAKPST